MKKLVALVLSAVLLMALIPTAYAAETGYTPAPQTAYAEFLLRKARASSGFWTRSNAC